MELLKAHEALDAGSFSFASIAIVRRLVHKIFKHCAYVDPFFERWFKRGVSVNFNAVLVEI